MADYPYRDGDSTDNCRLCQQRPVADQIDDTCEVCRGFIAEYIDSGLTPQRPVPMVADVLLVMHSLGVDQDQAVSLLGGTP